MLRRTVKRSLNDKTGKKNEKVKKRHAEQRPLGSEKDKDKEEHKLETLVLGTDEDIIEKLDDLDRLKHERLQGEEISATKRQTHQDRKPAWEDGDDQVGSIVFSSDHKFTGIKHEAESRLPKKEYTQRLKSQFEKITSTPNWAKLPSERLKQSDDEDSDLEELQHKTGDYLSKSVSLPKGVLQIKQCTDLNKDYPLKGKLKALEFHPSAQVALTGGMNGTLSLFQVDGKTNPKIQSVFLEDYPVYCAHFSTNGEEVILGSKHKSFKYYDMIAGKIVTVPRMKGVEENCMMYFNVSPDGQYLVFLGKYGRMHLLSSKSKEWITSLKMNGSVNSIAFTQDGSKLFSHGDDGQVYVWDIRTRDCIHRFMDEGCTQGTTIDVSPNSQYVACGSSTGVVNLYETETCLTSFEPKPLRAIMNLTTSCSETKFNSTSEILAIASDQTDKAVKLVHVSSGSVFSNFPERTDINLKIPKSLDFSVNSGYFSIGTHKGKALLYRATSDLLERTQIAKILMLQDQGRVGEFKNKCLDDIQLEDVVFGDRAEAECPEQPENAEHPMEAGNTILRTINSLETDISSAPDIINEALDEAEDFFPLKEVKERKKPSNTVKHKWSEEEEDEIKKLFKSFFESKTRPKPKHCLKAQEKSKKSNGLIWKRRKDVLKKKLFRMIDKL